VEAIQSIDKEWYNLQKLLVNSDFLIGLWLIKTNEWFRY